MRIIHWMATASLVLIDRARVEVAAIDWRLDLGAVDEVG